MDFFGIFSAMMEVQRSWEEHPRELARKQADLLLKLQEATTEELRQFLVPGEPAPGEEPRSPGFLEALKSGAQLARRHHSIYQDWLRTLIDGAPGLQEKQRERMLFWTRQFINALSPSNYFWTNFSAVKRFMDSNGESLARGLQSWTEDLLEGHPLMRMADSRAFQVGHNIAVTPGAVVFRNDLMELIQYEPATSVTYPVPVVFIQPWINKYYIFDLAPPMSFVRYMQQKGFTVFIISWKNPDPRMRNVTFDDYMLRGALQAIQVASSICHNAPVHAAGYCIGGTALSALMAWLNSGPRSQKQTFPVADWTLFSSLVDFSEPGDIGFFVTQQSVEAIEAMMKAQGFLSEKYIELVFRLLGSDSLIWRNFTNSFLYGQSPPKSDLLFWNSDSTRLPEKMCSFYLREFYLNNKLVEKDALRLGGRPIDLGRITQPLYAVGTQIDHICPWKSTFKVCDKVHGPVRYVLSSEGHITGIVNPPSEMSRRKYWAGEAEGETDPDRWLSGREERRGSWWEDWTQWLQTRSLSPAEPPALGSRKYPTLEKAPGTYVLEG
jgi:poly[(R)-3-hydroxyalkanoate] polymerase subunit PhaC